MTLSRNLLVLVHAHVGVDVDVEASDSRSESERREPESETVAKIKLEQLVTSWPNVEQLCWPILAKLLHLKQTRS